jgi:hypothetical protein
MRTQTYSKVRSARRRPHPKQSAPIHDMTYRGARKKTSLTDLPSSLADLGRETSLDGLDRTSRSAAVAGNEVETILTLGETVHMSAYRNVIQHVE